MNLIKKISAFILILIFILIAVLPAFAAVDGKALSAIENTAEFILKTTPEVEIGSIGGEWAIIGLARSEYPVPANYFSDYYEKIEQYAKSTKGNLHDKKYTEYSRTILALAAIGKDPANVAGYNLLEPLGDFNKTIWQGINGPIFALISLDCGNYEMPICPSAEIQATREMYVSEILSRQLADGGFALSGSKADPDITGMALQALSRYRNLAAVKAATDKALSCLSNIQDDEGGFSSWNEKTSESTAQVFMALCELGVDINDSRFVKNGNTVLDNLLSYYRENQGFLHTQGGVGTTNMSSEQCFYTLVNYKRVSEGKTSLYRMSDASSTGLPSHTQENSTSAQAFGLSGKHADIREVPATQAGKTFEDVKSHKNQAAIESLASRGIINGMTASIFAPEKTVTRAEFAVIIVKALGLTPMETGKFSDVEKGLWYAPYIGSANSYGLANGKAADIFAPGDTITRQEAAVMVSNAAKLCGINTQLNDNEIRDILAQFPDYTKSAGWARNSLALCYRENILPMDVIYIEPLEPVNRGEIAEMVYALLQAAKLQ